MWSPVENRFEQKEHITTHQGALLCVEGLIVYIRCHSGRVTLRALFVAQMGVPRHSRFHRKDGSIPKTQNRTAEPFNILLITFYQCTFLNKTPTDQEASSNPHKPRRSRKWAERKIQSLIAHCGVREAAGATVEPYRGFPLCTRI